MTFSASTAFTTGLYAPPAVSGSIFLKALSRSFVEEGPFFKENRKMMTVKSKELNTTKSDHDNDYEDTEEGSEQKQSPLVTHRALKFI